MNQLKKHLIRLHYILGYPFFDEHGKAFARWYVSDSEEKRYQYDDLTEKSLVFDGGGIVETSLPEYLKSIIVPVLFLNR